MLAASMAISALVISVAALGVAWLTISASGAGVKRLELHNRQMAKYVADTRAMVEKSTPAALKAELDDLRGALDTIRASNRRELGALWARVGGKGNGKVVDGATGVALEGDEELQALLALQAAKPVPPA